MTGEELCEILPEITKIESPDLKEKVIEVWLNAIKSGGWEKEDLKSIPFTLLIPDTEIDLITHTRSVCRIAEFIADLFREIYREKLPLNKDYLLAGALLHDVGKLLEYQKSERGVEKSHQGKYIRHPFSGTALAMSAGLPPEVIHLIATHAKEGNLGVRSPEAIIIHYADFMNFEPLKAVQ